MSSPQQRNQSVRQSHGCSYAQNRSERPNSGLKWFKSSFSFSNGNCVKVAGLPGGSVGVRDSRDPGGPVLRFTRAGWDAFLGGARNGEFDSFGWAWW
jgi:hypothetical protein